MYKKGMKRKRVFNGSQACYGSGPLVFAQDYYIKDTDIIHPTG